MYKSELKTRIQVLEGKIKNRDEQIAAMIAKNNSDKLKLEKLKLSLQTKISEDALTRSKARPKSPKSGKESSNFLSLCNCDNVGLYNKIILFPVAKCKLHNCYLDYQDVRKRKCVMRICKHMEWVNDDLEN